MQGLRGPVTLVLAWLAALLAPARAYSTTASSPSASSSSSCSSDELVVYRLYVDTHWSRELFPKQYPEWRPPAGWSKMVGRTHDSSYWLFREGEAASSGLQAFAEKGLSDALEAADHAGVYDEFTAPPLPRGVGRTTADFFLDGNHSLVSVAMRVVPSPDWFIGVDSLDLCRGSHWIDSIAIEVDPMDAGTDNGFTFTAPNWPSEPKEPVSRITSTRPAHPANSFYYPKLDRLPSIATLTFVKCDAGDVTSETLDATVAVTTTTTAASPTGKAEAEEASSQTTTAISQDPQKYAAPSDDGASASAAPSAAPDSVPDSIARVARAAGADGSGGATTATAPATTATLEAGATGVTAALTARVASQGQRGDPGRTTSVVPSPSATNTSTMTSKGASRRDALRELRASVTTCPAQVPIATLTFAQTEIDDIDDLLEERIYHLSLELSRGALNVTRERDQDLLEGNEISNDLTVGFTPDAVGLAGSTRTTTKARRSKKAGRQAKHCVVSEWSPWSACSASCGVGDATRSRRVLEHPRRGGRPCPALQEHRWCGGHSECPQNFFNW